MRYDFYQYQVGNVMQTARQSPWADIVWRGRLTVPGRDGKPTQVPVYRLRGAYWDCYYEDELQAAGRWFTG